MRYFWRWLFTCTRLTGTLLLPLLLLLFFPFREEGLHPQPPQRSLLPPQPLAVSAPPPAVPLLCPAAAIARQIAAGVATRGPPRDSTAATKAAWSSGVQRRRGAFAGLLLLKVLLPP